MGDPSQTFAPFLRAAARPGSLPLSCSRWGRYNAARVIYLPFRGLPPFFSQTVCRLVQFPSRQYRTVPVSVTLLRGCGRCCCLIPPNDVPRILVDQQYGGGRTSGRSALPRARIRVPQVCRRVAVLSAESLSVSLAL